MEAKFEIVPWNTPNEVHFKVPPRGRQFGMSHTPSFELKYVDELTLSDMCDQFRRDVFKKAGKSDPRHI